MGWGQAPGEFLQFDEDVEAAPDLLSLAGLVLGISVLASLLGIAKATRVEPNKVLS